MTSESNNDHVSSSSVSIKKQSYNYPFAAAPDIIRSHQKDTYFQSLLNSHLSTLLRKTHGARFLHTYTTEARTFSDFLYLCLTTLIGNRTLGEEYCDIVQVEDNTSRLPEIGRRAGYIVTSILLPYTSTRFLPAVRRRIRGKLEGNLRRAKEGTRGYALQEYLLNHLSTITSPSPIYALTLTVFYFTGSYYQLSKRLFGLRYVFTKRVGPSEARVGYEVLGVLLLLQIAVQSWLHIRSTLDSTITTNNPDLTSITATTDLPNQSSSSAILNNNAEIPLTNTSLSPSQPTSPNTSFRLPHPQTLPSTSRFHTPIPTSPHYDLSNPSTMKWIRGTQNRKCTLCLEELKDPSATVCGHVFCWSCIGDWVREKPECPLCRREVLAQHILPVRY